MGKSPVEKRLIVWCDADYVDQPQVRELADKGHTIIPLLSPADSGVVEPHLILSRRAHLWTPEMFDVKGLLSVAVKAARKRKHDG